MQGRCAEFRGTEHDAERLGNLQIPKATNYLISASTLYLHILPKVWETTANLYNNQRVQCWHTNTKPTGWEIPAFDTPQCNVAVKNYAGYNEGSCSSSLQLTPRYCSPAPFMAAKNKQTKHIQKLKGSPCVRRYRMVKIIPRYD